MSTFPFVFGIDTLDHLIHPSYSEKTNHTDHFPWTATIQGPDGCGKSILALHLASTYWCNNCTKFNDAILDSHPAIIYVSTDLAYHQAVIQWNAFGLDKPFYRIDTIRKHYGLKCDNNIDKHGTTINLSRLCPAPSTFENLEEKQSNQHSPEQYLNNRSEHPVCFVDLQASTAGDDWGWLNQFLSLLPDRSSKECKKHLLIIDAVEGLEMMVGDRDSYGNRRSRRSRIAQIIRNATSKGVHVVFVVEEPHKNARLPEQFVTDLVLRLRLNQRGDYSQRTVEVEKCRAIAHIRGEHEFAIRKGKGTSTGKGLHLDDPRIFRKIPGAGKVLSDNQYLAHIHVTKSLHQWNREVREEIASLPMLVGQPKFLGLDNLNNMLSSLPASNSDIPKIDGSINLLLGDAGTHKSILATHFLASTFTNVNSVYNAEYSDNVAILLTTGLTDHPILVQQIAACIHYNSNNHSSETSKADEAIRNITKIISDRVLCQRLGVRHTGTAAFVELLHAYIRQGQQLINIDPDSDIENRRKQSNRIHLVIDDWNQLLQTYPNFSSDPLLVPSLLNLFKREGISSLIVSTQPGQPSLAATELSDRDLRKLDENQIYTWSVPFYGERRVAITAYPSKASKNTPIIYELQVSSESKKDNDYCGPSIRREFALYSDVDKGAPKRIPLLVRLYEGNHPADNQDKEHPEYARNLRSTLTQIFPHAPVGDDVITFESYQNYNTLFSFAESLDDSRLDHSLVFQIDEFWSIDKKNSLAILDEYWNAEVAEYKSGIMIGHAEADPYKVYRPHFPSDAIKHSSDNTPRITSRVKIEPTTGTVSNGHIYRRRDMFIDAADGSPQLYSGDLSNAIYVNRIPYLWDFGIILTSRDIWYRYRADKVSDIILYQEQNSEWSINAIWDALCLPGAQLDTSSNYRKDVPYGAFLAACEHIAVRENMDPYGIDNSTPESLHCTILELWASVDDDFKCMSGLIDNFSGLSKLSERTWKQSRFTLRELLDENPITLFITMQLLVRYFPQLSNHTPNENNNTNRRKTVVSREWYHTASAVYKQLGPEHDLEVLAVPGYYSTRGDWGLGVAHGSRSKLLAERALDLLTGRRMNMLRLKDGIGLPVRDIAPDLEVGNLTTALTSRCKKSEWRREPVTYRNLCELGKRSTGTKLNWLWRSEIQDYDRSIFYFHNWLQEMFACQHEWVLRNKDLTNLMHEGHLFYKKHREDGINSLNEICNEWLFKEGAEYEKPLFANFYRRLQTLCLTIRRDKLK